MRSRTSADALASLRAVYRSADRLRALCPSDRAGNGPVVNRSGVGHEDAVRTRPKVERSTNCSDPKLESRSHRVSLRTRYVARSSPSVGGIDSCGPRLL